jgi:hypothetical protein
MRTLFTLTFLLLAYVGIAQHNFTLDNGQLIWQKVYETTGGESLAIKLQETTEISGILNGKFTGKVNPQAIGVTFMQFPIYMRDEFTASASIETKPDRYRVTVQNIQFKDFSLSELMLNRRGEFKNIADNQLPMIDKYLSDYFKTETKSDW